MATNRITKPGFHLFETHVSADRSAQQQNILQSIEAVLMKARVEAEAVGRPVLSYFLDMAIAEAQNAERSDQEKSRQQQKRTTNVIRRVS